MTMYNQIPSNMIETLCNSEKSIWFSEYSSFKTAPGRGRIGAEPKVLSKQRRKGRTERLRK